MHITRMSAIAAAVALSLGSATVFAESKVRDYRYDPHGRITGVILDDGTEVVGLSKNGDAFSQEVERGDTVQFVNGLGDELDLLDLTRDRMLTLGPREAVMLEPLVGPPIGGGPPTDGVNPPIDDARTLPAVSRDGKVVLILHAPDGAPSGFLLEDGTQVHLLPRVADVLRDGAILGSGVHVEGLGTTRSMWGTAAIREDFLVFFDLRRAHGGIPELGIAPRK